MKKPKLIAYIHRLGGTLYMYPEGDTRAMDQDPDYRRMVHLDEPAPYEWKSKPKKYKVGIKK